MTFRVGLAWFEDVLCSTVADVDDARDWLDGNDQAIRARRNSRALDGVVLAGGEVG